MHEIKVKYLARISIRILYSIIEEFVHSHYQKCTINEGVAEMV